MSHPSFKKSAALQLLIAIPLAIFILYQFSPTVLSDAYNDFSIEAPLVPIEEIHHGGPPRDGIPSIDRPRFIPAHKVKSIKPGDRVLGITLNGVNKAYPINILNWHEIVNDRFAGQNVVISYCPLCGTGMAFKSDQSGFGVSGLLYNSDVLLYDRKTESLWSQILGLAISGPLKGEKLSPLAMEHTTWQDWRSRYPESLVLSTDTGYARDYFSSPYGDYERSEAVYFPVNNRSRRYHPKERIIGVHINGVYKAYPFIELDKSNSDSIQDSLGGTRFTIEFDPRHRSGRIRLASGEITPSLISYWFAWYAFHPDTEIYTAP